MKGAPSPDRRNAGRRPMLLNVRCRIASGVSPEVWLTDLTTEGCQLILRAGMLHVGQRVVIKPREIEGLPGVVKWVFDAKAGISFDRPMHSAVVEHLLTTKPKSALPPERARREFIDQFGRPLPDWPRTRHSGGNRRPC